MRFFIFLSLFISFKALPQEGEKFEPSFKINSRYYSGAALIYDCSRGYLTCVDLEGLETCQTLREESEYRGEFRLSCAPLRVFKTRLECLKENYRVLEAAGAKRFCFPK